jgi:hypothetical protein
MTEGSADGWSFFVLRKDVMTMMSKIAGEIDGNLFTVILLSIILIAYFVYKEWPEFKKRVSKDAVRNKEEEAEDAGIAKELEAIKKSLNELKESVNEVKEKQARDYKRLNTLEVETNRQKIAIADSLKERKLLMKGIMACLDGLEQQGCNHIVPSTKKEIYNYLSETAHADDSGIPLQTDS